MKKKKNLTRSREDPRYKVEQEEFSEEKKALLKRTQKKKERAPLSNTKRYKKLFDKYIFADEDDISRQIKRIDESISNVNKIARHLHIRKESIKKPWKQFSWTEYSSFPKKLKKKRISPIFWDIYKELWGGTLTRKESMEITEHLKLDHFDNGAFHVLTIPDIEDLAKDHKVTPDNVRKVIARWRSPVIDKIDHGPIRLLRMTEPKNQGGINIYSMGYWSELRRVPFFSKDRYEDWLREILFHS